MIMGETNIEEKIIFRSATGALEVKVRLENETVWLNQIQMALLFW